MNIDESVQNEWLSWIRPHIKAVLKTGKFISAKFTQVLEEDDIGITFSVQYIAKTREDLDNYYQFDAEELRNDGQRKFADKMLAFRTELKIIEEIFPE